MFLGKHCITHVMDTALHYYVGAVVDGVSMHNAILFFDNHRVTPLWKTGVVGSFKGFKYNIFVK